MTESENIIPSGYLALKQATAVAEKIRKTTVLTRDKSQQWRIVMLNNRHHLEDDFTNNLEAKKEDSLVMINDSMGEIKRRRARLKFSNIVYLARILRKYSFDDENYISTHVPNLLGKITKLKVKTIDDDVPVEAEAITEEESSDLSGAYEVPPMQFSSYFKAFKPLSMIVEVESTENIINNFYVTININSLKDLECVLPSFRKSQYPTEEVQEHINNKGTVELKLQLKEKVLNRSQKLIEGVQDLGILLTIKSPLNKFIFTDLVNYDLIEVGLL